MFRGVGVGVTEFMPTILTLRATNALRKAAGKPELLGSLVGILLVMPATKIILAAVIDNGSISDVTTDH